MSLGNVFETGKRASLNPAQEAARAAVVDLARRLGAGQYGSQTCPDCAGGSNKERSLSLNIERNGVIKYYCHRASCGFNGTVYSTGGVAPASESSGRAPGSVVNPLDADISTLSARELAWFADRFHLPADVVSLHIFRTAHRYAIKLWDPAGGQRGWITRRPWDGSPADTEAARLESTWSMKALTYMDVDAPVQSWYGTAEGIYGYLVEDPVSALRLSLVDSKKAIAILGTGINIGKIAEMQRHGISYLTIALDADATGNAFAMARKWGQAFANVRVVVLTKDIKDCTDAEISALPL